MFLIGLVKQSNPRNLIDPKSIRTEDEVIDFFKREIRDFFEVLDPVDDAALRYHLEEPVPYLVRLTDTDMALLLGNEDAMHQATDQFTHSGLFQQLLG